MPGMLNPHRRSMPAACDRGCEGSYPVQLASKQEERRPLPYVNTVRRYPPAQSDRLQFPSASQEQQDPRSCNSGLGNHNREKHAVRCETGAQPVEIKSTHNHFAGQVSVIFGTRLGVPVAGGTLQTAINFNNARASAEMPFFNQDIFDLANALEPGPDDPQPIFGGLTYNEALAIDRNAGINRIDAAISQFQLDAVVSATDNPAWATDLIYGDHFLFSTSGLAAGPGYPFVLVPAGMAFGVPLGIRFFGSAFSEPTLIKLASGYEAFTQVRANNLPTFAETVPFNNIQGTTLAPPHRRAAPPPTGKKGRTPKHL